MDNYRLSVGIEPTDKYKKAKQDLLQALKSYEDLTSHEQERLMNEFFGAANVAVICDMLNRYFR